MELNLIVRLPQCLLLKTYHRSAVNIVLKTYAIVLWKNAEHLTSLPKRDMGVFWVFPHSTTKESACVMFDALEASNNIHWNWQRLWSWVQIVQGGRHSSKLWPFARLWYAKRWCSSFHFHTHVRSLQWMSSFTNMHIQQYSKCTNTMICLCSRV